MEILNTLYNLMGLVFVLGTIIRGRCVTVVS